ncbi:dual specificity protein phosphatase 13B-like [Hydra vulgaris]|uniref:Dual specificity protein phosphatase 13B-like n=1 Tax=Hydra vulgaris TaxID=6087 RepID=A0ABM4D1X2_HYDVU
MSHPFETINQVDENIFISGYLAANDRNKIRDLGITRIVKMFGDDVNYLGGYHRHDGVKYAVFPAVDIPSYDIRKDVVEALQFIREGINNNERILVHCHAGISRSSTIVLFYLMIIRGYSLESALNRLKRIRPIVSPNYGFMYHLRATDLKIQRLYRKK